MPTMSSLDVGMGGGGLAEVFEELEAMADMVRGTSHVLEAAIVVEDSDTCVRPPLQASEPGVVS